MVKGRQNHLTLLESQTHFPCYVFLSIVLCWLINHIILITSHIMLMRSVEIRFPDWLLPQKVVFDMSLTRDDVDFIYALFFALLVDTCLLHKYVMGVNLPFME